MRTKLTFYILSIVVFFTIFVTGSSNLWSQCTYCTAGTSTQDEYINRVVIGSIDNSSGFTSGVADYTSKITDMKANDKITATVYNATPYGGDNVFVAIDWNKDCDFDDSGEKYTLSTSDGAKTFTGTITVPAVMAGGTTRMRVRMEYYGSNNPCGTQSYGEVEDYSVNAIPPAPDAAISSIIPPTAPYNEGTWPVSMVLTNLGDSDLGSCTINWSVNGVTKTPVNWSGKLTKSSTVQILLGNHDFVYPDGGPYNPFKIDVWLTNIVGNPPGLPDLDASNNTKSINTAPSTEDAGVTAITQPSSAFVPGSVPIYVMIKNYARKALSVVDIDWYIDGVKQGSKKWFGSLGQNATAEVLVGNYNFYFKTPLAPFTIKAVTVNPNGVTDPIPGNDQASRDVAPSLVAGTYTIGGGTAHFPTMASAIGYLNASGIVGNGDVFLKINSGTYNEQVALKSFPHGTNKFYFESATGNAADVKLNFAPTAGNNYIFSLDGVTDVTFRNLTFNASNGGAGTALAISNTNNITVNNVVFNGVSAAGSDLFNTVRITNVPNISFANNTFTYGYSAIAVDNQMGTASFGITACKFTNYGHWGVNFTKPMSGGLVNPKSSNNGLQAASYPIDISNNEFVGLGSTPQGGVYLTFSASVTKNIFTNFASTMTAMTMSAITIDAPSASGSSLIENNNITNLTGVSGIISMTNNATINKNNVVSSSNTTNAVNGLYISGTNATVTYNKVNVVGNTTKYGHAFYSSYAGGLVANNLFVTTNGSGFGGDYNSGLGTYYNTFVNNSVTYPAANFASGSNTFKRNLVMNYGTGRSVANNNSYISSDNNVFFTKGATNASDLATYKSVTGDQTSANVALELTDDGTYKYARYFPEVLTYTPTGISPAIELNDYYGLQRNGFYYAGYAGIVLDISVNEQPESILACNGETNKQLYVSAAITYGAQATYQWQRNGLDIPGATNPIYKFTTFNYETSGQYRCKMTGPANTAAGVYSNEVLVYTLRPTEITKQPASQEALGGGTVFFEVEVHIKGIIPPYFQHKYQWWRHINNEEVQLMDNEYYANTRSPIMTITNLQDLHFNGTDDYYYCVIEGLCGKVTTNPVKLTQIAGEIVFDVQPVGKAVCFGSKIVLNADATLKGGNEALTYQWYYNGTALDDGANISGASSNTLSITNAGPANEGKYYCEATSTTFNKKANSDEVDITLNYPPTIDNQPTDQTLKVGENLKLSVAASGFGPISYQWYKDDSEISGATAPNFEITGVTLSHNGFFYCKVTNDCGTVKSTVVQVIVNKDGGISGVKDANSIALQVTPNPAISDINISFTLDKESSVEIAILDLTGKKVASKLSNAIAGDNNLTMSLGENVSNGTYFVQVIYNNTTYTRQIVVKK